MNPTYKFVSLLLMLVGGITLSSFDSCSLSDDSGHSDLLKRHEEYTSFRPSVPDCSFLPSLPELSIIDSRISSCSQSFLGVRSLIKGLKSVDLNAIGDVVRLGIENADGAVTEGFEMMEIAPSLERKDLKGQTVDWAIQLITTSFGGNLFNNLSRLKRNINV